SSQREQAEINLVRRLKNLGIGFNDYQHTLFKIGPKEYAWYDYFGNELGKTTTTELEALKALIWLGRVWEENLPNGQVKLTLSSDLPVTMAR
ncbi:MAG: hypothetical protein EBQ80_06075, partial [Proteobacteria bacterium]|nr:hypothetical protein [Pseudomonadota bacterium]